MGQLNKQAISAIIDDVCRELIGNVNEGLLLLKDGGIYAANKAFESILGLNPREGYSADEIIARLSTTDNATARACIQRLSTGYVFGPVQCDIKITPDFPRSVEITSKAIVVAGDAMQMVLVHDVTHEYQVEIELFETLSLLNSIFDSIEEAIFVLDEHDFTLRSSNAATEQTFKINRVDYKDKTLWELFADKDGARTLIEDIRDKLPKLGSLYYNFDMKRADGVVFPALQTLTEIQNTSGRKIALLLIVYDKSQRVYLNRALAEVEARYRILFDRAGDATFIIDMSTLQIIDANQAAEKQLGYARSELIGRTIFDISPESRHALLREEFKEIKREKATTIRGLNLTCDGCELAVQTTMIQTSFGGRNVVIATSRDISNQVALEQERLRLEKLEAVQQVAGGIAHEFSQPLQALLTVAELLHSGKMPPDKKLI